MPGTDPHLIARLRELLGERGLVTALPDMAPYLSDWRGRYHGMAIAIARPATTAETAAVVTLCAATGTPVVPQGGNTGLCGGSVPDESGRALVLSMTRMDRVRQIDLENDTITVEAGCTLAALQQAAGGAGRLFPLSLASEGSCRIGGNLSTNAGGTAVLRYGNMRELTLGLEVVLPDGRVWDGLRGLRKDNTGYDLKQLFIGAEGTLGVITAAVLKLFPAPAARATAFIAVPSPGAAVALLGRLRRRCGDRVSGFEIMSRPCLDLVLRHMPGARDPLPSRSPWYVLTELTDTDPGADLNQLLASALEPCLEEGLATDAALAESVAQSHALWALRENMSEAQRIEGPSIKHDVSVPVSRIAQFVAETGAALERAFPGARVVAFGHIGDGNLHYNLSRPDFVDAAAFGAQAAAINRIVHDAVHGFGGSISAEHGLGQLKRDEIRRYKSALELELMRTVKSALDPRGLMNPGKVLD